MTAIATALIALAGVGVGSALGGAKDLLLDNRRVRRDDRLAIQQERRAAALEFLQATEAMARTRVRERSLQASPTGTSPDQEIEIAGNLVAIGHRLDAAQVRLRLAFPTTSRADDLATKMREDLSQIKATWSPRNARALADYGDYPVRRAKFEAEVRTLIG